MGFIGITFDVGACVQTELDEDEFFLAQPDALGDDPRVASFELHHTFGFSSRPLDPETGPDGELVEGRACNLLIGTQGNETHAWLAADPRVTPLLPLIKKGESLHYGAFGNFVRCHLDGSISMFTTVDGTVDGQSVYFQVRRDGFRFVAPWGKIVFDATGLHVLHASGASLDLGSISGLPAPFNALASYISMTAAIVQAEASISADGAAAGASEPVAKATSLLTVLTAMQAAIAAMVPGLVPAAQSAAGAAVTASATALALGQTSVPSKSKQVT